MKKITYLLLILSLVACQPISDKPKNPVKPTISSLKVGAFNIQIFGVSKMSNPAVVDILLKTISRYDLLLIQEIRDAGGTSIVNLMNQLNSVNGNKYNYLLGPRLGRSTSKEQYAYIYNKNLLSISSSFTYDDSTDIFEREPLVSRFKHLPSSEEFIAIGIHVKPDDVINELNHLDNVFDFAENYWKIDNSIIMGDFNADCSYLSNTQENNLDLKTDNRFTWHIDTNMDTTLATSSCAYDRIITTGSISNKINEIEIFNFKTFFNLDSELAEDVSDHYPVGIKIHF